MELSEQEVIRRQSLQGLRDLGIDPYPAAEYVVTGYSTDIKAGFVDDETSQESGAKSQDCMAQTAEGDAMNDVSTALSGEETRMKGVSTALSGEETRMKGVSTSDSFEGDAIYGVSTSGVFERRGNALVSTWRTGDMVTIAGRLMSRRIMGKASFIEIQDSKGRIQVYVSRDDIAEGTVVNAEGQETPDPQMYNVVFKKLLDIGDIIGIEGFVFRTQMGEISIHAKKLTVLAKSLRPLPIVKYRDGVAYDKFDNPELRYRQRYVDLIVNEGVKDTFLKRSTILRTMRNILDEAGYTEVETPTLQSIAGGASARPFITHFNALDVDMYMRIATELYLKRLIVGGFEGVYEIGKNFRNEGMDRTHNPEFTCMELYVQYKDYNWMMSFTEQLLEKICIAVNGSTETEIDGKTISFKAPYRRLPILEAIQEKTGYDLTGKTEDEIRAICKELHLEVEPSMGKGKLIDEIFGEFCEGQFIQPTFITDYPVEMSPLTKMHRSKEGLTERFELMVNGKELANAYSELNDPIDQEERFKEQMRLAAKGDDEAMIIDQDFLRALQFGMAPTSGIGIGIDRLVMLMTGQTTIQEVLLFPQMKREN